MRFEVPQFIEIEDKVFGPFTWKQFAYLAGGAGMLLVLFFSLSTTFFILFGIPIAILTGALAFHKVNNRPFSYYLEAMFYYLINSKLYIWRRSSQQIVEGSVVEGVSAASAPKPQSDAPSKNLQTLSRELDLVALKGNQTQAEKWNEER